MTLPLSATAPAGEAVVVATAESPTGPWSYIPARLNTNDKSVSFTTTHFSWYDVLGYAVNPAVNFFKSQVLDILDSGITRSVAAPTCIGTAQLEADGYSYAETGKTALKFCLGLKGSTPILEVVNDRRYPLEMAHPYSPVLDAGPINYAQISSLSHFASGGQTIIAPGDEVTFNVALQPGHAGGVLTQYDSFGDSLYALQTGVEATLDLLSHFGLDDGQADDSKSVVSLVNQLLSDDNCLNDLQKPSFAVFTDCLDTAQQVALFGSKASLLSPVIAVRSVISFFQSSVTAAVGHINHGDEDAVEVKRASVTPQQAADKLYATLTGNWTTSGVVTNGGATWLAIGTEPTGLTIDTTIYRWSESAWVTQATLSVPGGDIDGTPDTFDAIGTAELTGSSDPDFLIHSTGADTLYLSVLSDVGGSWHAVPFDYGAGPTTAIDAKGVSSNLVEGEADSCLNSCAGGPETYTWYQYQAGEFQPTNPPNGTASCTPATFTALANQAGNNSQSTFTKVACADGWALGAATTTFPTGGSPPETAIALYEEQGSTWMNLTFDDGSGLATEYQSYAIPKDLLYRLAGQIGFVIPPAGTP